MNAFRDGDIWQDAEAYESYVGRWSRLVARQFIQWIHAPEGSSWLDVGCGSGALAQTILEAASPKQVQGIDSSEGYVAYCRQRLGGSRATFEVGDARMLPLDSGVYDAVVSGLVLNFVPRPDQMIAEMKRVAREGGIVGLYVWDYAGEMQLMRHFWDAAAALDPAAARLDEGVRFPVCQPEPLMNLFHEAGLQQVEVRALDVPTHFHDFDDYWTPFLGGQGPAPGYALSLAAPDRAALRERVRASLPIDQDGTIALTARAWGVRGTA